MTGPLARTVVCSIILVALSGCDSSLPAPSYHADIRPLLEQNCVSCHTEGGIAPFTLETYEDAAARKNLIAASVGNRIMPPWLAGGGCNTYTHDASLSVSEMTTVRQWADADAPKGDVSDYLAPASPQAEEETIRHDVVLSLDAPYTPGMAPDDYRCFVYEWPASDTSYVTATDLLLDNAAIVHHMIAYLIPPDAVTTIGALEDAEAEPGYTCFGGPGGDLGGPPTWLGAWAPGGRADRFAPEAGIAVEPGSLVVAQFHYNTLVAGEQADQSRVAFEVTSQVQYTGGTVPWTNPAWIINKNSMKIPAGATDVTHRFEGDPRDYLVLVPDALRTNNEKYIHRVGLHMHQLGVQARLEIVHTDGSKTCLLDIPRWDFNWQTSFELAEPVALKPDDKIALECTWDNGEANQPIIDGTRRKPVDIHWGEGTLDEMCLGVIFATNR